MPFAYFDHTGDIGVDLAAPSLPLLFEEAARAFTSALCDPDLVEPRQQQSVALAAAAVDLLLVDWLQELLYLFDVQRLLVHAASVTLRPAAEGFGLDGVVSGEPIDPDRHPIALTIKAVTYHGLEVTQTPGGWKGRVIFDI